MRQIKRTLDPNNVMNPGKYGLDGSFEEDAK
jgi:FAD/FMN-containing dehydrogenase